MNLEGIEILLHRVNRSVDRLDRRFRRAPSAGYNRLRMKKTLEVAALFAALTMLVGSHALAAGSWLQRAAGAPLQIVALCQSRTSHWEGGKIVSDSELTVLRVVRGAPDSAIVVRQQGGEVDGIGQKVTHTVLLEPGKKYLLFLEAADAGRWEPTTKGVNSITALPDVGETVGGDPLDQVIAELGGEA
jgi:hypothetical protein